MERSRFAIFLGLLLLLLDGSFRTSSLLVNAAENDGGEADTGGGGDEGGVKADSEREIVGNNSKSVRQIFIQTQISDTPDLFQFHWVNTHTDESQVNFSTTIDRSLLLQTYHAIFSPKDDSQAPAADADADASAPQGRQEENRLIVITFASHKWMVILVNWILALHRVGVRNYLVFSLDSELHEWLLQRDIPSFLIPFSFWKNWRGLWVLRVLVFQLLAELKINFVHSDIDAVWIRDPLPLYVLDSPHDFVFSQGSTSPEDVLGAWGFVLCSGFFYCRASKSTAEMLLVMRDHMVANNVPDQDSMNQILMQNKIRWDIPAGSTYHVTLFRRGTAHTVTCSKDFVSGSLRMAGGKQYSVGMIPYAIVCRPHAVTPSMYRKAFVLHPMTPAFLSNRRSALQKSMLYFMHARCKKIVFANPFQQTSRTVWLKKCLDTMPESREEKRRAWLTGSLT